MEERQVKMRVMGVSGDLFFETDEGESLRGSSERISSDAKIEYYGAYRANALDGGTGITLLLTFTAGTASQIVGSWICRKVFDESNDTPENIFVNIEGETVNLGSTNPEEQIRELLDEVSEE